MCMLIIRALNAIQRLMFVVEQIQGMSRLQTQSVLDSIHRNIVDVIRTL